MRHNIKFTLLLAFAAVSVVPAHAHRAWILPGATVLSSDDAWVTFDAAISNDIFHADYHAMGLDDISALAPDGSAVQLQNAHKGKFRSSFDLQLLQRGTYKVVSAAGGLLANWEQDGESKRWRGSKEAFAEEVPGDAAKLEVTEYARRIETFVTAGAPSKGVFSEKKANGLTLLPQTHPNDLYAGEKAEFQFLIDGKPAKGAEIEVVPGGMRYRDQQNAINAVADEQGRVTITWPAAGMYWFNASVEDDASDFSVGNTNAKRRASYTATFEVLPL